MGAKLKLVRVDAQEQIPFNAQYFYDIGESTIDPYQVQFGAPLGGVGTGRAQSTNTQLGLYVQDDWELNKNFTLNVGLRWDYERSPAYLNYVTPPEVVAALRSYPGINAPGSGINIDDYISTGNNRKTFTGAWQPRLGLSFDLDADQQHVVYGGLARAYDRNLFDHPQLETTKATFPALHLLLQHSGAPVFGRHLPDVGPALLRPGGTRCTGRPDRQRTRNRRVAQPAEDAATQTSSASACAIESASGTPTSPSLTCAAATASCSCSATVGPTAASSQAERLWNPPFGFPVPGYGNLILGTNGLSTRSSAIWVKADRPYSVESGWGVGIAYSFTDAKENRQFGEHYALDYPTLGQYGWKRAGGVSRHRVVGTGILDGPMGFVLGVRLTLATHAPRYGVNCLASPPDSSGCVVDQITPTRRASSRRSADLGVPSARCRGQQGLSFAHRDLAPARRRAQRVELQKLLRTTTPIGVSTVSRMPTWASPTAAWRARPGPLSWACPMLGEMDRRRFTHMHACAGRARRGLRHPDTAGAAPGAARHRPPLPDRGRHGPSRASSKTSRGAPFASSGKPPTPRTGLAPDRWPTPSACSIAAVGFALTAYCDRRRARLCHARRGAPAHASSRCASCAICRRARSQRGVAGYKGFFYHFLDMDDGMRAGNCELSTVDTALLLCGALYVQRVLRRRGPDEVEIRAHRRRTDRRASTGAGRRRGRRRSRSAGRPRAASCRTTGAATTRR